MLEDTAARGEQNKGADSCEKGLGKTGFLYSVFLIGKGGLCSCVPVLAEGCSWT